ncbi:unnamed protein product [Durusdinium trenchii]|uniref:Uncharacterized protein n=2 Tax=Durusdinium trenchii TaxID=1381693 RepID=A0ABP0R7M9_9DINO
MTADVAKLCASLDKIFKTFSTQEVQLDPKEMKNFRERGTMQYIEQKFQAHLQRARAAFLQEFRNHAVVVETEVRKIREEMTEKMEDKYGKMLGELRESVVGTEGLVQAQRAEISQLKGVVAAQETYMTAAKHKDHMEELAQSLDQQLENARGEVTDLKQQLQGRDEQLRQLRSERISLEVEFVRYKQSSEEEKREAEDRFQTLHKAMQEQQRQFSEHIQRYSKEFYEYKEKASDQLQILAILNRRLKEALRNMEEERERFILARTKPTPRIGEEVEEEIEEEPVELDPSPLYRTDDMGMDTAWRDYKINNMELVIPTRPMPKFKVERVRRTLPSSGSAQSARSSQPVPSQLLELPQVSPAVGTVLAPSRD